MRVAVSISPFKGIGCMVLSLFTFTVSDAVTKWLTQTYPIGELIFVRSFFIILPVLMVVWYQNDWGSLRTVNRRMQFLRAFLVVLSTVLIVTSLKLLPLADYVAFLHAAPLIITALAWPLLREHVGWHRWAAVIFGFVGILIMTRPAPGIFQIAALVPIAAACSTAIRDIVTRRMSETESTNAMMVWPVIGLVVASAPFAPAGWVTPDLADFTLMALSGFLVGISHYLLIEAYRFAEVTLVAPFKYSSLVWAVLLGYMVWGQLPDVWIATGATIVIASGLYILHRETMRR
jgi:drug/metabolite transporter (DMT)-like permease